MNWILVLSDSSIDQHPKDVVRTLDPLRSPKGEITRRKIRRSRRPINSSTMTNPDGKFIIEKSRTVIELCTGAPSCCRIIDRKADCFWSCGNTKVSLIWPNRDNIFCAVDVALANKKRAARLVERWRRYSIFTTVKELLANPGFCFRNSLLLESSVMTQWNENENECMETFLTKSFRWWLYCYTDKSIKLQSLAMIDLNWLSI